MIQPNEDWIPSIERDERQRQARRAARRQADGLDNGTSPPPYDFTNKGYEPDNSYSLERQAHDEHDRPETFTNLRESGAGEKGIYPDIDSCTRL